MTGVCKKKDGMLTHGLVFQSASDIEVFHVSGIAQKILILYSPPLMKDKFRLITE